MNILPPLAVFGQTLSKKCRLALQSNGFECVALPSYQRLGQYVSSHADLLLCPIGKKIFTYREYFDALPQLEEAFVMRGYEIVKLEDSVAPDYPSDIALNCLFTDRYVFANTRHTSFEVLRYASELGYISVNVKQGYARCTALPISGNAFITADPSIASAAEKLSVDVLRISPSGVSLEGYDRGFIGGASGLFEDRIFFAGDILSHEDGKRIVEFCKAHKKEVVSLSNEELKDIGSIFFFK